MEIEGYCRRPCGSARKLKQIWKQNIWLEANVAVQGRQYPGSRSWQYCLAGDEERGGVTEPIERRDASVCSSGEICKEPENIVAYGVSCEPS